MGESTEIQDPPKDGQVEVQPTATHGTYIPKEMVSGLSPEHQDYLLKRHGTLELDPIPDMGDADPYNWPKWKVCRLPCGFSRQFLVIYC